MMKRQSWLMMGIGLVGWAGLAASPSRADEIMIPVKKVDRLPASVEDPIWARGEAVEIPLVKQDFILPHGGGSVNRLQVKVLAHQQSVAFQLTWKDATKDDQWDASRRFSDGAAIQLPEDPTTLPSPFMGEKGKPVVIWRWRAIGETVLEARAPKVYVDYYRPDAIDQSYTLPARPTEALYAEGFGTITPHPTLTLEGAGRYREGEWQIMLKGPAPAAKYSPVAFAVWDGAHEERDGQKSLSLWHWLVFEGGAVPPLKKAVDRGRRVFARYGCGTCHGPEGQGGVPNPNAQTGPTIPALQDLGEKFTDAELIARIRQGLMPDRAEVKGPPPFRRMPTWVTVSDSELADLLAYLKTLKSGKKKGDEW